MGSGPSVQKVPILKCVREHAKKPSNRAVVESSAKADKPVALSYTELLSNIEQNSAVVQALVDARPEGTPKHVAYLVNPGIGYVVVELSVWAAGCCCVPLSVHSPAPELEYFLQDSEAPVAIAGTAMEPTLRPVAEGLGRIFAVVSAADQAPNVKLTPPENITVGAGKAEVPVPLTSSALILYTSGTTGKPKGVVHTFNSLTSAYKSLTQAWKWTKNDYTLHVLPLHHIHGVQNILNTALFNGACVEFTPFDASYCLQRLTSGDVTCFHAVPTIYTKFTQYLDKCPDEERGKVREGLRNPKLRYMVSGSAALPVPTMKSWADISGHVLLERYGMTEIGMSLSNRINGTRYPGCVGWKLPQVQVKQDTDGGILVKGGPVFKEYYNRKEATEKEFTPDGWFRTGDNSQVGGSAEELQALQDVAREVEAATGRPRKGTATKPAKELKTIWKIMGRSSVDIIKSGGYKISALEIESVLLQHERIKECAVVGKPDATWGEKVTAVCILDGALTLEELRAWGKDRMATYKVPAELEEVTELPRNQMGKLEKKKILDRYKAEAEAGAS